MCRITGDTEIAHPFSHKGLGAMCDPQVLNPQKYTDNPDLNIKVFVKKPPLRGTPSRSIEWDRSNMTCSPGTGTPVPGRFANTTRGFLVSMVQEDNVGDHDCGTNAASKLKVVEV